MRYWNRNYRPVAYTWFADIYCAPCGTDLADVDPEGNDKGAVYSWEISTEDGNSCGTCGSILH